MEEEEFGKDAFVLPPEHLRRAGHCLPDLTDELLSVQSSLWSEVSKKEAALSKLQNELVEVKDVLSATEQLVCGSIRSICLKDDTLACLSEECERLERDVIMLGLDKQHGEAQLKDIVRQKDNFAQLKMKYRTKMDAYQAKINRMDATVVQQEIKEMRKKIDKLQEKRRKYMMDKEVELLLTEEPQRMLQSKISAISDQCTLMQQANRDLETKIAMNLKTVEELKKRREARQKRQAAQVRRLQRLLNEAQARKRQWMQEGDRLRANIEQIRVKMNQ